MLRRYTGLAEIRKGPGQTNKRGCSGERTTNWILFNARRHNGRIRRRWKDELSSAVTHTGLITLDYIGIDHTVRKGSLFYSICNVSWIELADFLGRNTIKDLILEPKRLKHKISSRLVSLF